MHTPENRRTKSKEKKTTLGRRLRLNSGRDPVTSYDVQSEQTKRSEKRQEAAYLTGGFKHGIFRGQDRMKKKRKGIISHHPSLLKKEDCR